MNKIKLFIEKEIQKEKNIYLKELYLSGDFKPEELLYFFPNNYLKRNHIPMLQGGRRKRYKKYRLTSRRMFKILEEIIDERIDELFTFSSLYDQFVDFRNLKEGEAYVQDVPLLGSSRWERPVYALSRATCPAEDFIWNTKENLRCTTRILPANELY